MYYRNAGAGIIVYDITDMVRACYLLVAAIATTLEYCTVSLLPQKTFKEVPYWLDRMRSCAVKNCVVFIVGNKCDADPAKRQVGPRRRCQA